MKLFKILLFVPLLLFSTEELSIALKTKSKFETVKIKEIINSESTISPQYLAQLKNVMKFDFCNNGYTSTTDEKSSHYEINLLSEDKKILCSVKNKKLNKTHRFEPLHLCGTIDLDRQKIHRLSDQILYKIFNVQGIASTKILYSVRKKSTKSHSEWTSEIWMSDYDGHNVKQVTNEKQYNVSPAFIPLKALEGHQNFLYVSYKRGQPKIFRATLKNPIGKSLFTLAGNQLLPSVSKDCKMVAFVCDADGRPDLFLQRYTALGEPIGKPVQLFSYPRATQATSSFSPDGSKLAFLSDKDGPPRVYTIEIPHQQTCTRPVATLISKQNRHNSSPDWSYDGKKILYSAVTDGVKQIWVYDLITKTEKQLTFDTKNKENPRWAPNSLHLVYNTEDGIHSELYIINLNHPIPIQITFGDGQKRFPSWEPKLKKRGQS